MTSEPFRFNITRTTDPGAKTDKLRQVMKEIDDLVGLDAVKQQLEQLIAYARLAALRRKRDLPTGTINLHMVFAGPPGTGKTEVARKVGRMLAAIGLLKSGHCIEVDKSHLIAGYQGQTDKLVDAKVREARDGVLFIDEAYSLAGIKVGQTGNTPSSYEQDAIDKLLKAMEDNRDRLVVIAAGYTQEMRAFLEANTGLKSRFSRFIEFEPYSPEQLMQMFLALAKREGFTLTSEAERDTRQEIKRMHSPTDSTFGNARAVRTLFERILTTQSERLGYLPDLEDQANAVLMQIEAADVATAAAMP